MAFAAGAQAGANAIAVRDARNLGRRGQSLKQQELDLQQRRDVTTEFATRADATRQSNIKQTQLAIDIVKAGREAGTEGGTIDGRASKNVIGELRKSVQANAFSLAKNRKELFGGTNADIQEEVARALLAFDAAIKAALNPTEEAQQTAKAGVAGAQATSQAATAAGVPTTTESALVGQGTIPAPETANVINFQFPDGSIKAVDQNDDAAVADAIRSGARRVTLAVQAESVGGLSGVTQPTQRDIDATRRAIQDAAGSIDEVKRSIQQFEETPEAGGLLGPIIEGVGGVAQQIEGLVGAEGTFENVTGVDPAQVRGVRADARALAASLLTTITKEESGRFTDTERRIAAEVLAALEPDASAQQIQETLQRAKGMIERAQTREISKLQAQAGITDAQLATREGVNAFGEVLVKNGLTREQAKDALKRLLVARKITLTPDG